MNAKKLIKKIEEYVEQFGDLPVTMGSTNPEDDKDINFVAVLLENKNGMADFNKDKPLRIRFWN